MNGTKAKSEQEGNFVPSIASVDTGVLELIESVVEPAVRCTSNEFRPYEPTGMTTARWMNEVTPRPVSLISLRFCQQDVSIQGLLFHASQPNQPSFCGDQFPHIVKWHDELWVSDGHHRVIVALLKGETHIVARVIKKHSDGTVTFSHK